MNYSLNHDLSCVDMHNTRFDLNHLIIRRLSYVRSYSYSCIGTNVPNSITDLVSVKCSHHTGGIKLCPASTAL